MVIGRIFSRFGRKSEVTTDDAYYTAGQMALIKARFKRKTTGVVAAWILGSLVCMGFFAGFFSPVDPTISGADKDYRRGAPQMVYFWDQNGFSLRPFTYTYQKEKAKIDLKALAGGGLDALDALTSSGALSSSSQNKFLVDEDKRRYLQFFVKGWEYSLIDLSMAGLDLDIRWDRHLFGVENGQIHLMGTDEDGKDVFSRTLHAVWITISIAVVALVVKLFTSLLVGGVSGYFGGRVDTVMMSITEAVRVIPPIPIYLACAVALAELDLTSVQRYFAIAVVIGST